MTENTDTVTLQDSTDAMRWAQEFVARFRGAVVGNAKVDEGLMVGWFANAIESGRRAGRDDADGWRMAVWLALPDVCFIASCDNGDIDQRGPVWTRNGGAHKACTEHWEPIFRVLGEQSTWEHDAYSTAAPVSGGSGGAS